MNKKIIIGIAVFVGLAAGGVLYLSQRTEDKTVSAPVAQSNAQNAEPTPQAIPNTQLPVSTKRYVDYTQDAFDATSGTKVLFFHAPWCSQCRQLDDSLKANIGNIPDGTTVLKVDFDTSQDLRKKYNVTFRTALVKIDSSGTAAKPFIAYDDPTFEGLRKNGIL